MMKTVKSAVLNLRHDLRRAGKELPIVKKTVKSAVLNLRHDLRRAGVEIETTCFACAKATARGFKTHDAAGEVIEVDLTEGQKMLFECPELKAVIC